MQCNEREHLGIIYLGRISGKVGPGRRDVTLHLTKEKEKRGKGKEICRWG